MMSSNIKNNKVIILEQAVLSDVEIIEESTVGSQYKLKFRAKLQEADVINNNRRVYPADTLQAVYAQLKPKALERKLVGEMDHPQPSGDNASKIKRSSTLALDRVCVLFADLEWDGNSIFAVCETLSNTKGMDLYALLKDRVTIGFSLRAFGETRKRADGVTEVLAKGIKALTYDVVANPSHDNSVILEFLDEGTNIQSVLQELTESYNNINKVALEESSSIQGESEVHCFGNICIKAPLQEAIDYIVEEAVQMNTGIKNIKVQTL